MDFMQRAGTSWTLTRNPAVRRTVKIAVDFSCGALAVLIAFILQSGRWHPTLVQVAITATLAGAIVAAVNSIGINYRTTWRYAGLKEPLVFMVCSAAVFAAVGVLKINGAVPIEWSSVTVAAVLAQLLCSSARTARRWRLSLVRRRRRGDAGHTQAFLFGDRHRVLIVGAGHVGFAVGQQLQEIHRHDVDIVGYLDDDRSKIGTLIDEVPVLGPVEQMLTIAGEHNATEVIIAMPSAPSEFVRALIRRAEDIGLRARTVGDVGRMLTTGDPHRPGMINLRDLSTEKAVEWSGRRTAPRPERRVLVTGGAGFIGSHLTRMLLERGYNVRVLDNFTYGFAGLSGISSHPRLDIVAGDICNLRDVSRAMRDVDGVIALAAIVGDPACNLDPEETINLNYAATKILAEAADFYRVQRLVFASSCSVYGASLKEDDLLNERSRLNPVSLYARTRVLSENIVFDRCGDTEPVVLRLATVFGLSPRMRFDLVVNTLTARAVVDHTIAIFGGRQWRPNVHCRDAARAFLMALEAPGDKVAGEVFNVGGDSNNHRISEIGDIVASIVGDVQVSLQNEIPDPRDYRVSFEKIQRVLSFVPEYSVVDGVREVAAAMRADLRLRTHMDPMFHNVQALRQALARPELPPAVRATA
jgi:nucleoside-diphosphate-sugar epimerase